MSTTQPQQSSKGKSTSGLMKLIAREKLQALRKSREEFEEKSRAAAMDTSKLRPGIYSEDGKQILVIPISWLESTIIGHMVVDLVEKLMTGVEVGLYDGPKPETTQAHDEKFLLGLWFGFYSSTLHKRGRDKKSYELGQTHAQALLVKQYFDSDKNLGLAALERDNYFFGNHSGEKVGNTPVVYDLRHRLQSFWIDDSVGSDLLAILNQVARSAGLCNMDEQTLINVAEYNLIKPDQVVQRFKQPITVIRRGKAVNTGGRTPNKPRSSPLLLSGEMGLVSKLISPFWEPLTELVNNWGEVTSLVGYEKVVSRISTIMDRRWKILQKFSRLTTKRLQEARAVDPVSLKGTRKANITIDNVSAMLKKRKFAVESFYNELLELIPQDQLLNAVEKGIGKGRPKSRSDSEAILKMEIAQMYVNTPGNPLNIEVKEFKKEILDVDTNAITKVVKAFSKYVNILGNLRQQASSLRFHTPVHKLPGKLKAMADLVTAYAFVKKDIGSVDKHYIDLAFGYDVLPVSTVDELLNGDNDVLQLMVRSLKTAAVLQSNQARELVENKILQKTITSEYERLDQAVKAWTRPLDQSSF